MAIQIVQFREDHLGDAADLACQRYKLMRKGAPLLPPKYESPDTILPMLGDLLSEHPGVVALQGERLVGYMAGLELDDFLGKRAIFSPEWANAASLEGSRRIYEELYARISAQWVASGCYTHLVSLFADDRLAIEGWHWLGFGLAAVDGLRGLEPVQHAGDQVQVRRAGMDDLEEAGAFQNALGKHMIKAPIFWPHEKEDAYPWLVKPELALWLAYLDSRAIGFMQIGPANQDACTIIQDEGTASILGAYTLQEARREGVATALLNRSLGWAREQGYVRCAVDFEPMNLLATRFWNRYFEPVSYTLMRSIP
jgi:GNAT superfamily N-acetyltransferase